MSKAAGGIVTLGCVRRSPRLSKNSWTRVWFIDGDGDRVGVTVCVTVPLALIDVDADEVAVLV